MTTAIYASLSAFLLAYLSLNVIKERRENKVPYGDGGNENLQIARAAQSNATEYIPIALLLLFALEYNRANIWVIHALGIALIVGRSIHAYSLLFRNREGRVLGMQITIFTIIGLAILNLFYVPYSQMFKL
jgi:uncharacterized membrane protein YecN with MAPEG domain